MCPSPSDEMDARREWEMNHPGQAWDDFKDAVRHAWQRVKDDVREVTAGHECGMSFENYQDMRVGDVIECYRVEQVQRTL